MKTFAKNPLPGSVLAILLLIAAIACKKDKAVDLSRPFTLSQTEAYHFQEGSKILATATLTAIEDSRCPINANCAYAGYGSATLKIKDLSISSEKTITLYIGQGVPKDRKDLKEINLNGTNYILQLKDIRSSAYGIPAQPPFMALFTLTKP